MSKEIENMIESKVSKLSDMSEESDKIRTEINYLKEFLEKTNGVIYVAKETVPELIDKGDEYLEVMPGILRPCSAGPGVTGIPKDILVEYGGVEKFFEKKETSDVN